LCCSGSKLIIAVSFLWPVSPAARVAVPLPLSADAGPTVSGAPRVSAGVGKPVAVKVHASRSPRSKWKGAALPPRGQRRDRLGQFAHDGDTLRRNDVPCLLDSLCAPPTLHHPPRGLDGILESGNSPGRHRAVRSDSQCHGQPRLVQTVMSHCLGDVRRCSRFPQRRAGSPHLDRFTARSRRFCVSKCIREYAILVQHRGVLR
jgi:hypothetical protein